MPMAICITTWSAAQCSGAYNLSPHYLEEFRETLVREFGFVPDMEHFSVTGVCAGLPGAGR